MKRAHGSEAKGCRELAAEILLKVEKKKAYADILLDHALKTASLSRRDQALLTQLVYGALRWRGNLDWRLGPFLHRPLSGMDGYLRNLLRLTLYQLLFLDKIPAYAAVNEGVALAKRHGGERAGGMVNAVLRRLLREKNEPGLPAPEQTALYLSSRWSHPEWLVRRWLEDFGRSETEALLKANNEEACLVLRVNTLKGDREALLERLRGAGLESSPTQWSPQGIHVESGAAVDRLPGFLEGLFQIQGEASQMVGYLLKPEPGESILDACAAPGGKATHLAELMKDEGEIVATDISARGLEKLKQNVQRLGLRSVHPFLADAAERLTGAPAGPYDRILVDAPCSALGTLRSHPEAKWQKDERDIQRLSRLQKKILDEVAPYLKPGGVLVYATCTLIREENERVVEDFLLRQKDFILESAREYLPESARDLTAGDFFLALPHKHDTDGFFAARLRKQSTPI